MLPALLRGWFGPSAGHPGTSHQVAVEIVDGNLVLRPVAVPAADEGQLLIPLFPTYAIACGAFDATDWSAHQAPPSVAPSSLHAGADPSMQFLCFARGDSMDGGEDPVRHGDLLLLEWARGVSAGDLVGERVLVEFTERSGTAAALKLLERAGSGFELRSSNPVYPPVPGGPQMRVVARLRQRLDQFAINQLAPSIGRSFKRMDVAPLYGQPYNPGNWQSGHVSLPATPSSS